jgi:2,4-dienoyl-CoA reductase-like NADH-dependent reductase (Old Yellow Enzyme family)
MFSSFKAGSLELRNRVVMSPMSRYRSPGGLPNATNAAYYERRAKGGVGLIISEATYIDHPGAPCYANVPNFFGAEALAGWRRTLDLVHAHGAKMMPQLWHVGGARKLGMAPDPAVPGYGPSAIAKDGVAVVVAMRDQDRRDVADAYARGAAAAREAGFDGVAVHGAHGYLLDQYFWPTTNKREDAYGGPIENRVRFGIEVVAAMRAAVGPDFPILFRYSQWKAEDYEARIADDPAALGAILLPLAAAGVDIFDVSARRFYQPAFAGDDRSLAAWTRVLTGKPVIAVGSVGLDQPHQSKVYRTADNVAAKVTDMRLVEEGFARGDFDLVAVGRAMLADADWVEKVKRAAFDEIEPFTRAAMDNYV